MMVFVEDLAEQVADRVAKKMLNNQPTQPSNPVADTIGSVILLGMTYYFVRSVFKFYSEREDKDAEIDDLRKEIKELKSKNAGI